MRDTIYLDADDGMFFSSIEEALLTKCPLCGTPLDWELKLLWSDKFERQYIYGYSASCGIEFVIEPELSQGGCLDGYSIRHLRPA